jgi:hypothetical protein
MLLKGRRDGLWYSLREERMILPPMRGLEEMRKRREEG